jgi:hypothetical protein
MHDTSLEKDFKKALSDSGYSKTNSAKIWNLYQSNDMEKENGI